MLFAPITSTFQFKSRRNAETIKNNGQPIGCPLFLVEATGLEPTTFWSLTKRATKLRYASICFILTSRSSNCIIHYTYTNDLSQAFFACFR